MKPSLKLAVLHRRRLSLRRVERFDLGWEGQHGLAGDRVLGFMRLGERTAETIEIVVYGGSRSHAIAGLPELRVVAVLFLSRLPPPPIQILTSCSAQCFR